MLNPLEHPLCLDFPHLLDETAWAEHIPFAMFLVSALRPRLFVELGAYRGVSYCAFCQSVKTLQLPTKCYAVDTWQGDEHAGHLEGSVLSKLKAYHDPLYAEFSRLVQSTFDDALPSFADASIDLLHIDGFHTYEAVRHDFETWRPKMSSRGVIIFHDTNVRERDFGVWKFWSEVSAQYSHFEFLHGHGLGVLGVGEEVQADLKELFAAGEAETALIRKFFHALGERISAARTNVELYDYNERLKTYENVVRGSRLLRAYRALKEDGLEKMTKKSSE